MYIKLMNIIYKVESSNFWQTCNASYCSAIITDAFATLQLVVYIWYTQDAKNAVRLLFYMKSLHYINTTVIALLQACEEQAGEHPQHF